MLTDVSRGRFAVLVELVDSATALLPAKTRFGKDKDVCERNEHDQVGQQARHI